MQHTLNGLTKKPPIVSCSDAEEVSPTQAGLEIELPGKSKGQKLNKGYRHYLKVEGSGHFVIDEKQVKAEERYDGIWVLRTNTVYNAETVAHVYKALWTVEDIFRTTKSILETRPIYHKRDETIRGHVFCSFLVLILKQELESRLKRTDLEWEWKEVIRGLNALQQVEANFQGRRFLFRNQLTDLLRKRPALPAWQYRPPCRSSSHSIQAGNVVPRDFCPYVSRSATTI